MRERLRIAAAATVLVMSVLLGWRALYEGDVEGHLVVLALLAALPAVAGLAPRARSVLPLVAMVLAAVGVVAVATGTPAWRLMLLQHDAWGHALRSVGDGLMAASSTTVPASPVRDAPFTGLLDMAFAALAGGVAWQAVVRRRILAAVVLTGLALAYRWTVLAPAHPVLSGCMGLGALLAALALTRGAVPTPRHGWAGRALVAGVATLLGAGLVAPGMVTQDRGWWDWRTWSLSGTAGTSTGLDLRQNYGRLNWPDTPRVVMRVRTPLRLPLRAAVLSEFDGVSFGQSLDGSGSVPLQVFDNTITVRNLDPAVTTLTQRVRFQGLRSSLVLAGGDPVRLQGPFTGRAERREGGTVLVDPSLGPGAAYTVSLTLNDPAPAVLVDRTAYAPGEVEAESAMPTLRAGVGMGVLVPRPWGTATAADLTDAQLGPYARVREAARRVAGDATSPYVAANRIERYLRTEFTYDEAPPEPAGDPPLVDFLFRTRAGFCQHFAGSMVLMLRTLGIPSRVVVGYTPGRLDTDTTDEWVVMDRDAHSWVQVLMPGAGWVDFDPTPGRGVANQASVSSLRYRPPPQTTTPQQAVAPTPVSPPADPTLRPEPRPADPGGTVDTPTQGRGRSWWLLGIPAGVLALLSPAGVRLARRARRARRGDERTRLLAAVGDLEGTLRRSGLAPPVTVEASARARWLRTQTGLEATHLYAMASAARYAPQPPPPGSARTAWRTAGRLRREAWRRLGWWRRLTTYLGVPASPAGHR